MVPNKDSRLIKLQYPFHLQAVGLAEKNPGSYYVFIYRKKDSGTVRFTKLSLLQAYLFDTMLNNPGIAAVQMLHEMAKILKQQDIGTLKKTGNYSLMIFSLILPSYTLIRITCPAFQFMVIL